MKRRALVAAALAAPALAQERLARPMPGGGMLPAVGLGTWLTFHVALSDHDALARRAQVLARFFAGGGALVDSSPMYTQAEAVLGAVLPRPAPGLYAATKVWTPLAAEGPRQLQRSLERWRLPRLDLLQVHNLLAWREHLPMLRDAQARGLVRHIGVTTSHGSGHDEMAHILRTEPLQFMQVTYSPADTRAEPLLALAAARGVAVIVNRPFDGGALLARVQGRPLPAVAQELGCRSWAALALKWTLAHPAVACAIPASSNPAHVDENMAALGGPLPTARQRGQIAQALLA